MERFLNARRKKQLSSKPWWDEHAHTKHNEDSLPEGPIVLVQHGAKGTRISAVGPDGAGQGLWAGMKLTDARAMMPEIHVEQHDTSADHSTLVALANWMLRYSPAVAMYGDDGFLLDTTGCDHLFGGEHKMALDIKKRFTRMHLTPRLAFADTVGACIALVNHGADEVHVLAPGAQPESLDALPVQALRLDEESTTVLIRLGLKRIGDVRRLPRISLQRRFGDREKSNSKNRSAAMARSVQWRLDQLSGEAAEPLCYISTPRYFRVSKPCPDMALEHQAVEFALDHLLPKLSSMLNKAGQGARCFQLTGYRADGGASAVEVHMSQPSRSPSDIKRLFKDRLDQIDCGYGIDLFVLSAVRTEALIAGQHTMIDADNRAQTSASVTAFADVIGNRFGRPCVGKLAPRTSHVPERAQRLVGLATQVKWEEWAKIQPAWAPRPLRLFAHPEPAQVTAELPDSPPAQFIWRRVLRRVVRARGPERILPEWWHDSLNPKRSASFRDYYDVEDRQGQRYWIYRSISQEPVENDAPTIPGASANDNRDENERTLSKQQVITTVNWFVHGLF